MELMNGLCAALPNRTLTIFHVLTHRLAWNRFLLARCVKSGHPAGLYKEFTTFRLLSVLRLCYGEPMNKVPKSEVIRARVTKEEKESLLKWATDLRVDLSTLLRLRLGLK
jgi:hypothetical protein